MKVQTSSLLAFALFFPCLTASAQIAVLGELSDDRTVRQGETYEGSITLRNDTDEPGEAKVYQTDYMFFADGTNRYGIPGTDERSNADWLTFRPSHVIVPPHGTETVYYTVTVPHESTVVLNGSFWSMIMIEGISEGSPESSLRADDETSMGLRQTIRYGVQIATHIVGSAIKNVEFLDTKLLRGDGGEYVLQLDIGNNGLLWMRPAVSVELFDSQGKSRGRFPGVRYRLYPGTSIRETIALNGVPSGTYKALVVIDGGGDDIFGAQYTLEF